MSATRVRNYLSQGAELTTVRNMDRIVLRLNKNKSIALRDDKGNLTAAGYAWQQQTGRQLKQGGFLPQEPKRQHNKETIRLRNGQVATTRRYNATKQE